MSDEGYDDADWEYEVDSVQRHGTTAATQARRHGEVSVPDCDGEPNDDHSDKDGSDRYDDYGIPTGI